MKKFIQYAILTLGILGGSFALTSPILVRADAAADACAGIKLVDPNAKCDDATGGQNAFGSVLRTVINTFSIVVGAVSVIMIIIGGFRYIISAGDSSATKSAKDTILYAVIGLAVVLFAQVIVRFVISNATKPAPPPAGGRTTTVVQQA